MYKKVSLIRAEKLAKAGYSYASKVPEGSKIAILYNQCQDLDNISTILCTDCRMNKSIL
jgi:hypothetical protein